jgi:uncharacterized membrane protein
MNSKQLLSTFAASCFIASLSTSLVSAKEGFKCYGVSGPGENDCDPLDHKEHLCTAESKRDKHIGDWQIVGDEAECKTKGGFSEADARKKLGLPPAPPEE